MTEQPARKRLPNWILNLLLALGGIVLAIVLAQGLIALFPGLLPSFLRLDPPERRKPCRFCVCTRCLTFMSRISGEVAGIIGRAVHTPALDNVRQATRLTQAPDQIPVDAHDYVPRSFPKTMVSDNAVSLIKP